MSNTCLDDKDMFFKRLKSGRVICSFLLFSCIFFNSNVLRAQEVNIPASATIETVASSTEIAGQIVASSAEMAGQAVASSVSATQNNLFESASQSPVLIQLEPTAIAAPVASGNMSLAANNMIAVSPITIPIVASDSMGVVLKDVDGDGLNDAIFENKNVRLIVSSKNGSISNYYLKGLNYEEELFPPVIASIGYRIPADYMNCFTIDNQEGTISKTNYNISVESENPTSVVIKATANISTNVNDNTPDANSFGVTRRFMFANEGYSFKIENVVNNLKEKLITIGNDASGSLALSYGPGIFMDAMAPSMLFGLKNAGECETFSKAESLNEKAAKEGSFVGIGIKDSYFSVLMESEQQLRISCVASETKHPDQNKRAMTTNLIVLAHPKFNLGAKESRTFTTNIYAGPVVFEELQKINRTKIGDFGFLNTMMLKTLRFFYSLVPNYGVAIILLTLLIRLILYPLTLNQTKSMAKMQKIQPKIKALQERYKDDPQKMNEEMMKLYTKEKVNPFGGCLPLLLQLPIIMALYNTIRIAVELRKAPFLWISDLSKGDPYLILPIAIAALMYYQQGKTNVDPQQKQMMSIMPMMMFLITWSLPSGLLVYWFASSILGLLQQLQANHYMATMKEE